MTEPTPIQQYEVVADPSIVQGGNGKKDVPDGLATIDEQSRQAAMARSMIENEKRAREQRCAAEIDAAITAILKKHNCIMAFTYEINVFPYLFRSDVNDEVKQPHIGIRPIAIDKTQPGQG